MEKVSSKRSLARAYGSAALVGSVMCWGAVPVLLRHLTTWIDGWTANGFRYPLSALCYWPILWHGWRSGKLNQRLIGQSLAPAILALGGQILWAMAPYYLPASAIGFLVRFSLVWSVLAAVILFADERRLLSQARFYLGLAFCIGGFALLSLSGKTADVPITTAGIVIMFFCSLFFGLYSVSVRRFLRETNPTIGFGLVSQYVSIGTLLAMWLWGVPSDLAVLPARGWAVLVASAFLGIAMGHFFLYTAVQRVGAAITAGVQSVTPFVTVTLATLFLGETMTPLQWLAGVSMVTGAGVLLSAQHVVQQNQFEQA